MGVKIVGPNDGKAGPLAAIGVRFMIWGEETGESFSLVEHPMPPRALAAPMHRHANEDEYSYVLEGRMGADLGGEIVVAEPGDLVFKPRDQWHTFWNAGDEPARVLELISPGGFEGYFAELAPLLKPERDFEGMARLQAKYGLEMDFSSIERLSREHGLGSP
jgi:mannose-6-phosphate isomerase-like protein (cupin superfamily)